MQLTLSGVKDLYRCVGVLDAVPDVLGRQEKEDGQAFSQQACLVGQRMAGIACGVVLQGILHNAMEVHPSNFTEQLQTKLPLPLHINAHTCNQ